MASSRTPTPLELHIAKRLTLARKRAGLKSVEAAAVVGVGAQQYSRYECAENRVFASRLYYISRYFQLPVSWFFLGYDDQSDPQLADLGEPQSDYRVVSDEEELEILISNWRRLSARQKDAVFNLLSSIVDRE